MRCLKHFSRAQSPYKIPVIDPAQHLQKSFLCQLSNRFPVSAPCQRAKPHAAAILTGRTIIDSKPRVAIMSGCNPSAIQHFLAPRNALVMMLQLIRPFAGIEAHPVIIQLWNLPYRREYSRKLNSRITVILHFHPALQQIIFAVSLIMQIHAYGILRVKQLDLDTFLPLVNLTARKP